MRTTLVGCLVAVLLLGPLNRVGRSEIDAEQVRLGIERSVAFLKREQRPDGSWVDHVPVPGGVTYLATLALLNAGVGPNDPEVKQALAIARKASPTMTYSLALQTLVLCAAEPKKDLLLIRRNVQLLENLQIRTGDRKGTWPYAENRGNGDNSNTQFALLALYEAERAGVEVKEPIWRLSQNYWLSTQNPDGSWGYVEGAPGTGSMTCAGISAMIMTSDRLTRGDVEVNGERVRCCGQQQDNSAIENGLAWMGRNFSVVTNPGTRGGHVWLYYYLYGLERVGRLTNQRLMGQHDWYRRGAEMLVESQDPLAGFWKGGGLAETDPTICTALSLLFLSKGRRPVVVAKLKHEPLNDWNHHRSDLANLVSYVEKRWERDLTWQVMDMGTATVADLNQAPVLFLSGQKVPEFNDQQVRDLREYINRGGFLFAENCCTGDEFDRGFRDLMDRVFPEPEYQLRLLPPDHPVWNAEEPVPPEYARPLWGIDIGCRTSVVYCPKNLGCYWELARPGRSFKYAAVVQAEIDAVKSIGINVLAYATNRELKFKLDSALVLKGDNVKDKFDRAKLYIAELKHNGGWNSAPGALPNLLRVVSQQAGMRVSTDHRDVSVSDEKLFGYPLVFLHGRNDFVLTDSDRKNLRLFVERGGMVFGDAICGSDSFAQAFQREMALVFPEHKLQSIPESHEMFTTSLGGFDIRKVTRREPRARGGGAAPLQAGTRQGPPELDGIQIGGRYGVIFSRYDLSCALEHHDSLECAGYIREDAARIGLNLVLYSLNQ